MQTQTTNTTERVISKKKSYAFGKDIYLLGVDQDGTKYWLETPKWDCGWYWGFGYVETYTNNNHPERSKDISSHSHISGLFGAQEYYDSELKVFRKGEYIHNIYDSPTFAQTTFTKSEGWTLTELFSTFYSLQKSAEVFGRGGAHVTDNPVKDSIIDAEITKRINTVMIPAITAKIIEILSPK